MRSGIVSGEVLLNIAARPERGESLVLGDVVRGQRDASRSTSMPPAACRAFHVYTDCRDTPYRTATAHTATRPAPPALLAAAAQLTTHALRAWPSSSTAVTTAGELLVASDAITSGYWKLPAATSRVFSGGPDGRAYYAADRAGASLGGRHVVPVGCLDPAGGKAGRLLGVARLSKSQVSAMPAELGELVI